MSTHPHATLSDVADKLLELDLADLAHDVEHIGLALAIEPPAVALVSALVGVIEQRGRDVESHARDLAALRQANADLTLRAAGAELAVSSLRASLDLTVKTMRADIDALIAERNAARAETERLSVELRRLRIDRPKPSAEGRR